MNLTKAIQKYPYKRDFIYHKDHQKHWLCSMVNGTFKAYSALLDNEEVWIKENGKYVAGKIVSASYNTEKRHWNYYINTKSKKDTIRKISDFKILNLQKAFEE